jgi:putative transposase
MKTGYKKAKRKNRAIKLRQAAVRGSGEVQLSLNKEDLIRDLQNSVHEFAVKMGLRVGLEVIEQEVSALCGARHERGKELSRYGSQGGYIIIGGQKVSIERPRVRGAREVELESYKLLQNDDAISSSVVNRMIRGVSSRDYQGTLESLEDGFGVKKSSVSRHFVAASKKVLKEFQQRRFDDIRFPVIFIDGIEYAGETLVGVLGVDMAGNKHVLGLRHGATENKEVVKSLLEDLVSRGVSQSQAILFVIDGGKALSSGIKSIFGRYGVIQRCQIHKRRNVLAHVPEQHVEDVKKRLAQGYNHKKYEDALKSLNATAKWLDRLAPDAADSLREGMEQTITVINFQLPEVIVKSLASTNIVESAFSVVRKLTGRVKRWRSGDMRKRWCLAGLMRAEKAFKRIKGYKYMSQLVQALDSFVENKDIDIQTKAA